MAGPLVGLRDGATHQMHGGNAGAITGADGQVAGHGEGFGRQGAQSHQVAPAGEESPLSGVDALGVIGEDGLQGRGHAPVGGAQGRRSGGLAGNDLQAAGGGGHKRVSGGGLSGVIATGESRAITPHYRAANGRAQVAAFPGRRFAGLSPGRKTALRRRDRPHVRACAGASIVAFRNCTTTAATDNAGDQWIGIQCIGINTYPLE